MMLISRLLCLFVLVFCCACAVVSREDNLYGRPALQKVKKESTPSGTGYEGFTVYAAEGPEEDHYIPSGFMGDSGDLKTSSAYRDKAHSGSASLRVTYLPRSEKGWAGIYWQDPAGNWGNLKGGYDQTGASKLTFWARGELGGETIAEFKSGGISGPYGDSDVAWISSVRLTREWRKYSINLSGKDLGHIIGAFSFSVNRYDNPGGCTFYIDEVRFE